MAARQSRCLFLVGLASTAWLLLRLILEVSFGWRTPTNETTAWTQAPQYCNIRAPSGAEGKVGSLHASELTLRAVAVVIRHGDRSAIHAVPNGNVSTKWRCSSRPAAEPVASDHWHNLTSGSSPILVRSLKSGVLLKRSLAPALLFTGTDSCAAGQLTPRGVEQHLNLGRHLARAYAPFITRLAANATASGRLPVYARCTDYQRTLLSAASLVTGMLPTALPTAQRPLVLHTEEEEARDVMHGVGLSSSSRRRRGAAEPADTNRRTPAPSTRTAVDDQGGETTRTGRCAAAATLARQQLQAWQPDAIAWERLTVLFGETAYSTLMTSGAADMLFARACHGQPLPCSEAGCVDAEVARRVMRDADRFYCARFAGPEGGLRASRLSMLPLLLELFGRLQTAVTSHGEPLILFSGHDTVVAPLLAALGGMRTPSLCRWPPYASRLAFEVWLAEPPRLAEPPLRHSAAELPADPAAGEGEVQAAGHTEGPVAYVRVLFNGRVVTHTLHGCRGRKSLRGISRELCPLTALSKVVQSLATDFRTACGIEAAELL